MASIPYSPTTGVIVTGAASGIGRASAEALAEAGRAIACWDLNGAGAKDAADSIAAAHGVDTLACEIDVRDIEAIAAAVDRSRDALGTLGGLVHAAGMVRQAPADVIELEQWHRVMDVNLTAALTISKALAADLRANAGSAVVGIASVDALIGHGIIPSYNASKAGLLGLMRSMADHFAEDGVRFNCVCPGYIDTPMLAPSLVDGRRHMLRQVPMGRLGRPREIATAVRFLMSDDASFVTGEQLVVDGGLTRTLR